MWPSLVFSNGAWDTKPLEDEKETVKFIMKVYHDFKQTIVELNT
jgi:hypothetical protein